MPDRRILHAKLAGISIGKAGLLSGPVGLCGICLRRIRPRISPISTAERDWSSASLRRPEAFISAPGDVHGIRRTTPPPRRWRRTNISPTGFLSAPASPTLGGEYFFLHDRHRAHRPAGHEREDALGIFQKLGGTAFVKPLTGSRGDFAQAIARRSRADPISRRGLAILRRDPDPADRRRDTNTGFSARRRGSLYRAQISARSCWAMACSRSAICWPRTTRPCDPAAFRRLPSQTDTALDTVLPKGERWEIPGRMNLSAGGTMVLEAPRFRGRADAGEEGGPRARASRRRRRPVHRYRRRCRMRCG